MTFSEIALRNQNFPNPQILNQIDAAVDIYNNYTIIIMQYNNSNIVE